MSEGVTLETQETPKRQVKSFRTTKGSVYTYDQEGKTTRFKTATDKQHQRQDITVFVELKPDEEQRFLEAYHHPSKSSKDEKVYVVEKQPDNTPRIIRDIQKVNNPDNIYLGIVKGGKLIGANKASLTPVIGYIVFDTRHYQENGKWFTERHLGNRVADIQYVDK